MKEILVIGDCCIDIFVYCDCERLCPEAPVPVLDVIKETKNFGMAGNVYRNITSLGAQASLICNDGFSEVTKTRYVDPKTNHMFCRIDSPYKILNITNQQLKKIKWDAYSAVVISDYNKGFLNEADINHITKNHKLTFLDTKKKLGEWAENSTFIKINRKEYNESKAIINSSNKLKSKIIQTLGFKGCEYQEKIYPVKEVEIKNLSGAGDSFLAGLVVKYLETNDISQSLCFANECATIVVQKLGVSTISKLDDNHFELHEIIEN